MPAGISAKANIDGAKKFQDDLKNMTAKSKALSAQMNEMSTKFDKEGKSMGDNTKARKLANEQIDAQKQKISLLEAELKRLEQAGEGESTQAYKLREQLAKANTELINMQHSSGKAAAAGKDGTASMLKMAAAAGAIAVAVKGAVSAIKSIAGAASNAAKAIWNLGVESGQWADNLITLSNQTGVDVETLQEWGYAARFIDTEVSSMTKGMTKLTKAYAKGASSKKKMVKLAKGVTVSLKDENGQIKSQSQFFLDTIDALHGMTNEAQRNKAAQEIFGKSYTDLLPLINSGTAALREYSDEARDMGAIISGENVTALGGFDDTMQRLGATFDAIKTNLAVAFLPMLQTVAERLSGFMGTVSKAISDGLQEEDIDTIVDAFFGMFEPAMSDDGKHDMNAIEFIGKLVSKLLEKAGANSDKIKEIGGKVMGFVWDGVKSGLGTLASNFWNEFKNFSLNDSPINTWIDKQIETYLTPLVTEWCTAAWNWGKNLFENIGEGVLSAEESVFTTISNAWTSLTTTASGWLTSALEWGMNLITNIGTGISTAWETAKTTVSDVGTKLFELIGGWVTDAAESGKTLISGFVSSIYTKWGEKLTTLGNIGTELKTIFGMWIEAAKSWGKDLISKFVEGLKSKWSDLKEGIKGIGRGIKDFLGFSEPKKGPLSDFHTYAPDMVDLFVRGIRDNAWRIDNALASTFGVLPAVNPAAGGSTTNLGGVTIVVNGAAGQDVNSLADIIMERLQSAVDRREAVFA